MADQRTRDLTVGKPLQLVLRFAAPLLFGLFFQQLYSFVDTAIVGRTLGSAALAAVGSTGSLNFMVLGLCTGMCSGFAIPIAQSFGAREEGELRRYVFNAAFLCAAVSLLMAVVTGLMNRTFLVWMSTPVDILDGASAYIGLIFWGIPATVLYNMAGGILRSLGDSRTPVLFLVLASVINIVLDLVFILVAGMGVEGAALATLISQLTAGTGCLIAMKKSFPVLQFRPEEKRLQWRRMGKLLCIGLPMGLQYSITAVGSVIVQSAVNVLGTTYVAAVAAAGKLSIFFTCVFDALSATIATFAGQNIGARKVERVSEGLKAAAFIGIVYCVIAFLAVWLLGRSMLLLFVDAGEAEVLRSARRYLLTSAAFYIPLLFVYLLRLCIQGMGYTPLAVCAGVAEMIARMLVGALLIPRFGFAAACFSNPVAWIAADLFLVPAYCHVMKQLKARMLMGGPGADNERKPRRSSMPLAS